MIKYIGSKRLLIPKILEIVTDIDGIHSVCDLFSGTSRVGQALKSAGYFVHANDVMSYAYTLAHTYVAVDSTAICAEELEREVARLDGLPGCPGYITRKFAEEAHYFKPSNGARIDAIRAGIEDAPEHLRPILLAALMLAADRVDSTVGVQMAYLKGWSERSGQALSLKRPVLTAGPGEATQRDALDLASEVDADLVYLDPPYNQHSYLGNYHIWESLVLNDQPETYGKANKRVDCRTRRSPFNLKTEAEAALEHVISSLRCKYLLLSFNDEGYVNRDQLEQILARWGEYTCLSVPHRRHVGARIGIYNMKGERVGKVSHVSNHEFLFLARRR